MKDTFAQTNFIKEPTCFKSQNSTLLGLILTNGPRSFMQSQNFDAGFSDCHKHVCSILRASFQKLPPKIIRYRDQKHFDQKNVLYGLDSKLLKGDLYINCDDPYEKLSEIFVDILNHQAHLKKNK